MYLAWSALVIINWSRRTLVNVCMTYGFSFVPGVVTTFMACSRRGVLIHLVLRQKTYDNWTVERTQGQPLYCSARPIIECALNLPRVEHIESWCDNFSIVTGWSVLENVLLMLVALLARTFRCKIHLKNKRRTSTIQSTVLTKGKVLIIIQLNNHC